MEQKGKNDAFSNAETRGRQIYKKLLDKSTKVTSYTFTPTRYDQVDAIVEYVNCSGSTELKYRDNYSSTDKVVQDEGALIEKIKYDYLQRTISESGLCSSHYVMLFNDNVGYCWNLKKIPEPKWFTKKQPKTTAVKGSKIPKVVGFLKLSDAKRFTYK